MAIVREGGPLKSANKSLEENMFVSLIIATISSFFVFLVSKNETKKDSADIERLKLIKTINIVVLILLMVCFLIHFLNLIMSYFYWLGFEKFIPILIKSMILYLFVIIMVIMHCTLIKSISYIQSKLKNSNTKNLKVVKYYTSFKIIAIVFWILSIVSVFAIYEVLEIFGIIGRQYLYFDVLLTRLMSSSIAAIIYVCLYFLPYLIATKKQHRQIRAIYILNIFAGWTIIIWFVALVWANTEPKNTVIINQTAPVKAALSDELLEYKKLLDSGVITQEEFEAKKNQLLGL